MNFVYTNSIPSTEGQVLCCQCGRPIPSNPTTMCFQCAQQANDITQGISRQCTLNHCRGCDRYLDPPANWVHCALQSQDLLRICLKRVHGLEKVKVVDVMFLFTEEHSMRIKLQISVVDKMEECCDQTATQLQHHLVVEFVVQNQICTACQRKEAKNFWKSMVQVRQKVDHKKTFLYLEQLILKHKITCAGMKVASNGMDFLFDRMDSAAKFSQFILNVVPSRRVFSKKLISQDIRNNTKDYKTTFSVEIAPICKDDIICLPLSLARSLGQIGQLCICQSLTNHIKLIDPQTAQVTEVESQKFWKSPFSTIAGPGNLKQFTVMDTEFISLKDRPQFKGQGAFSHKHSVLGVWVVPSDNLEGERIYCRTHLGHILKIWDTVLGFDLRHSNVNNKDLDQIDSAKLPDIILVKKIYPDRRKRRTFKLKRLANVEVPTDDEDLDNFMDDLEEDAQIRKNVNLFRRPDKISTEEDDEDVDPDYPAVSVAELLDDLKLED